MLQTTGIMAGLFAAALANSTLFGRVLDHEQIKGDLVITQVLSAADQRDSVVIQKSGGIQPKRGDLLGSYRLGKSASGDGRSFHYVWVKTGEVKVVQEASSFVVAQVVKPSSQVSPVFFPRYPKIMAGDVIQAETSKVESAFQVLPTLTLSYDELFVDPKADPTTFELSESGRERLRQAARQFGHARIAGLMVEGYTDPVGQADANQIESYQRAFTIRQALVDDGFDPQRVVALGLGESVLADESYAAGFRNNNRRIILKPMDKQAMH